MNHEFHCRIRFGITAVSALAIAACVTNARASERTNYDRPQQQVVELLKSIETGDSKPIAYINADKYISTT